MVYFKVKKTMLKKNKKNRKKNFKKKILNALALKFQKNDNKITI